jgi:hypothetical protein
MPLSLRGCTLAGAQSASPATLLLGRDKCGPRRRPSEDCDGISAVPSGQAPEEGWPMPMLPVYSGRATSRST